MDFSALAVKSNVSFTKELILFLFVLSSYKSCTNSTLFAIKSTFEKGEKEAILIKNREEKNQLNNEKENPKSKNKKRIDRATF